MAIFHQAELKTRIVTKLFLTKDTKEIISEALKICCCIDDARFNKYCQERPACVPAEARMFVVTAEGCFPGFDSGITTSPLMAP